jgi:hypothetical protein
MNASNEMRKWLERLGKIAYVMHQNGNNWPNAKDIARELDKIPGQKYYSYDGLEISSLQYVLHRLPDVPSTIHRMYGIRPISINAIFYINGCIKPKSIDQAKRFLTSSGHPIYGIYFHIGERDLIYQAHYLRNVDKANRLNDRNLEFLVTHTEANVFSDEDALQALAASDEEADRIKLRNDRLRTIIQSGGRKLLK